MKRRKRKDIRSFLSDDLKVALKIYECELEGELVWLSKLKTLLSREMSPSRLRKSLDTLIDWGIVRVSFAFIDGRAARVLYISGESKSTIRSMFSAIREKKK